MIKCIFKVFLVFVFGLMIYSVISSAISVMNVEKNVNSTEIMANYTYKNATVIEIADADKYEIDGAFISDKKVIILNYYNNFKVMTLIHEYCHWQKDSRNQGMALFFEEMECNLQEINPLNYLGGS